MEWNPQLRSLVLSVYGVTMITGLPANLLALYTFCRKIKHNAKPIDIFLLSLTISDLVFLFFLPFRMKEAADMKWDMPFIICPLTSFIFFSNIYNSSLLLAAISVERYLGVAFPITYKVKRRPLYNMITCILFCVVSMANCSIVFIVQYYKQNVTALEMSTQNACYVKFNEEQLRILLPVRLELAIAGIFLPFIICCFCYINFILILYRLPNLCPKKRFRAIGLAMTTLVVFTICFLPYGVSSVVGFICHYSSEWRVYALLTSTFNACLDPFIFYFSSTSLRKVYNNCIQALLKWMQVIKKMDCRFGVKEIEEDDSHQNQCQSEDEDSRQI